MKIFSENLGQIGDIIAMGRLTGGAIHQLSLRVQDECDKGPIQ